MSPDFICVQVTHPRFPYASGPLPDMNLMTKEPDPTALAEDIEEILTDLVKNVVRNPDGVKVSSLVKGPLAAFVIKTDQEDVRRVVGQRGKHIRALQAIVTEAVRRYNLEAHVAIDEKTPQIPATAAPKAPVLGKYDPKRFRDVKDLLRRVVGLFVEHQKSLSVSEASISQTSIFEVKLKKEDYPSVYGRETQFDYGTDGIIIGSIKNIFDGIGKNNGRFIKIVFNQV